MSFKEGERYFFSAISNVTNSDTNWLKATPLADNWVRMECDVTGATTQQYINAFINLDKIPNIKPNTTYTFAVEFRNVNITKMVGGLNLGKTSTSGTNNYFNNVIGCKSNIITQYDGGIYKALNATMDTFAGNTVLRNFHTIDPGDKFSYEYRLSLLEGDYTNTDYVYEEFGASPSPDYPSSIETFEYKNLCDNIPIYAGYGLNDNGELYVGANYNVHKVFLEPNTTYTVSEYNNFETNSGTGVRGILYDSNDNFISRTYYENRTEVKKFFHTFTTTDDTSYILIQFRNTDTEIQLTKGTEKYPYVSKSGVALKISGKNYFNANKIEKDNIQISDNGKTIRMPINASGNGYTETGKTLGELCPDLKVGDNVFLNFERNLGNNYNNFIYLSLANYIWNKNTSITITDLHLRSGVVFYGNRFQSGETEQCIITDFRITKNVDDEWEEYKEPITAIFDLQGNFVGKINDIKDRLYIENGNLYLEKKIAKVVIDGSENWEAHGTKGTHFRHALDLSKNTNIQKPTSLGKNYSSTHFVATYINNNADEIGLFYVSNLFMVFTDMNQAFNAETWKQFLLQNNVEVYYELAEPYVVHLGKITIPLHEGYNHIELLSNLETEMSLEYQTVFAGDKAIVHIKYSEDGETFTPADEDYTLGERPSAYYGTYTDYNVEDSTNFEDYKWYKFTEDIDKDLIEMQNKINNNSTSINNNYQELNDKLNDKASVENVVEVSKKVETLQTSTTYTINVLEDIQVNGVTKVDTKTGFTFGEEGMKVDKTGAPTGGRFDEAGVEIVDKLTAALNTLFYSGYVDEEMAAKVAALTKYLGQTVTYSNSLIFQKYLSSGNARLEDIQHDVFGKGLGIFMIGSDE